MTRAYRLVALLGLCFAACAATPESWPTPIAQYLEQLRAVEQSSAPRSLEAAFAATVPVQDQLMLLDGQQAWLETLDEARYAKLGAALRGLRLSRGVDVYAQPEPEFWMALAQQHGAESDRAFFVVYRQSWDASLLPSYLRITDRASPCVRFGENLIGDLYAAWSAYQRAHPAAYTDYVSQQLRDLEEAVELGTCTCSDQADVERELRAFRERFADSRAVPGIGARLRQLQEDPDRRPVYCR